MSALPGDPTFNPLSNHYDVASYKRDRSIERFPLYTWQKQRPWKRICLCTRCDEENMNIQGGINSVIRCGKAIKEDLIYYRA